MVKMSGSPNRLHGGVPQLTMSRWQRVRTFVHLYLVGVRRRMVLGTRVAVFDGDRVLLLRHTYLPGWHFPGGGVEPGEAAADAAAREMSEETGLVAGLPLQLFGLYHNVHEATNRDHLALFVCRQFSVGRPFRSNAEIAEIGWFGVNALPIGTEPGTIRRIDEIGAGTAPPPRW